MKTRKIFQNNDTKRNVLNFFIKFFFESLSLRGKSRMIKKFFFESLSLRGKSEMNKKFFFESLSLRGKCGMAIIISICAFIILAFGLSDNDPKKNNNTVTGTGSISSKQMDRNNIRTWYRNNGSFNRDPATGNSGFEWPKGTAKFARYASGLWMGAVVGNDTLMAIAEYDYEYLPGYIDDFGNPQGKDDSLYRIYKINKGDTTSEDYLNWPAYQGAYTDENGKPFLMGEQTMFFSFTDGYPEAHGNNAGGTAPLKAQILQTNWSFKNQFSFLNEIIVTEMRIINRGSLPWTKCHMALWTDDDVGVATDDAVGCDTNLNLGYTYNYTNFDGEYGSGPPAVGFLFLKGQSVPSQGDTVKYYSPPLSKNLVVKPNYKDLGLTVFNMYNGGNPVIGDPSSYREAFMNFQGLRRDGTPWVNPITNQVSKFPFSGNPYDHSGWIQSEGDDRRFLQVSGPSTVNPGDTQIIAYAQIISRSITNVESVRILKIVSGLFQKYYDNNFDISVTAEPVTTAGSYSPGNGKVYLSWDDSAENVKYLNRYNDTYYNFQGYNIYQVSSYSTYPSENDTVLLKTFDKNDGIKDIRDSVYVEEYQGFIYGIVQRGSDNGISRYIELDKDSIGNQSFVNGAEYKYCVTAYYYDPSGGPFSVPKVIESPKRILKVIPQMVTSGTTVNYSLSDTVLTDQKDLAVMPVIIDPMKLVSASYTTIIGSDSSQLNWTLTKTVNGITSILFQNENHFSYDQDSAKTFDGLILVNSIRKDSGIVRDPQNFINPYQINNSIQKAWTYKPEGKEWFTAPDTTAIKTAKLITDRQFDSRSLGMSFPTQNRFINFRSRITANGKNFTPGTGTNTLLTGGPLKKIKIIFGETSKAYRYAPNENVLLTDTNLSATLFKDIVNIPFSAYAVDELDSTQGNPRRLNIGFVDADANGQWDPDDSPLGKYQFTYIFASDYSEIPEELYMTNNGQLVNTGSGNPIFGFSSLDIMYAWMPRVKNVNGVLQTWQQGDELTVAPYRITKDEFVPGYPVKYSWTISGTTFNNTQLAATNLNNIKAFPNPYYGFSSLEFNDAGEKIIYFSNLPAVCDIYIYSLDGSLVKQINRNTNDPNSSLEKWDIKNNGGEYVASGMYIVYLDCKDAGAKTLKIAVFQSR